MLFRPDERHVLLLIYVINQIIKIELMLKMNTGTKVMTQNYRNHLWSLSDPSATGRN